MIFISVGTQLSFDRLTRTVDDWLSSHTNEQAFFQIAEGKYHPKNGVVHKYVADDQYQELFDKSDLIISHAGMGTIITALECGKPVIVMPRRFSLGEHRNDHQMATAQRIGELGGAKVAWDESELSSLLNIYSQDGLVESNVMTKGDNLNSLCSFLDSYLLEEGN